MNVNLMLTTFAKLTQTVRTNLEHTVVLVRPGIRLPLDLDMKVKLNALAVRIYTRDSLNFSESICVLCLIRRKF